MSRYFKIGLIERDGKVFACTLKENVVEHFDMAMDAMKALVPCYRHRIEEVEEGGYTWVHVYPAIQPTWHEEE